MRSATMIVVADGMSGGIGASTTRSASTPRTSTYASTMAVGSEIAPIETVDVGCRYAATLATMFARSASPSSTVLPGAVS